MPPRWPRANWRWWGSRCVHDVGMAGVGMHRTVYVEHSALTHEAMYEDLRKAFAFGSAMIPILSE